MTHPDQTAGSRGLTRLVLAVGTCVLLLGGCSAATGEPRGSTPDRGPSSGPSSSQPIDLTALPQGAAPRVPYLAGGELRWRGRTVETDLPDDALYPRILGSAGGAVVVSAYQSRGREAATRFWAIDRSGEARRLGRGYESSQYPPVLVRPTGHLWVYAADRTTPPRIWQLDARTGREVGEYADGERPTGLAPADQVLVDSWLRGRGPGSTTVDRTRDGSLEALVRTAVDGVGDLTASVVVRRTADGRRVARFDVALGARGGVDDVVLEGRRHVLALFTASANRRGSQQVVVRCRLGGACERATAIGGPMALGLDTPVPPRRGSR